MAGPIRDYFLGLSLILVAGGGYQITAAKWLMPPTVEHAPIASRPLNDHDESLADLYPEDAWQRGRSIRLKTQDGMLLFQNWEQNKDERDGGKKWRLWPITMVIGRGLAANGSDEPILIEAEDGAVIEFSSSLDVMSGVAPTIQRGQLLGNVHIQRAKPKPSNESPNAHDAADGASAYQVTESTTKSRADQTLDIRTANVGIDRRKIWTTEAIEMRVGRAVMIGRDLTLHLAASTGAANSQSSLARSLDRMELIYLRELTLPLGNSDRNHGNTNAGSKPRSNGSDSENQGVVQIHCDGRIEYDFALDQLVMNRNVRLVHRTGTDLAKASHGTNGAIPPGASTPLSSENVSTDQFECESLRLTLRDPLNSDRVRSTAIDWIDRIEAGGSPVRLSMPSQGFELTAEQVLFDPLEGWLVAGPTPNKVTENSRDQYVQLRRGDMRALLSRIVYRFDPKTPEQLGSIDVDGQGRLDYDAIGSVFRSFSWRDSLKVAPLDVATADDINVRFGVWCDGDIRAALAGNGSFQTDRIEGVLKPVVPPATGNPTSGTLDHEWFPDRFSAIGNVEIRSAQLHASTPQMNLFFEQSPVGPRTKVAGAPPNGSAMRQWVSQPDPNTAPGSNKTVPKTNEPPATIRGDQVTAKLTLGGGELSATDLSVVGNVEVTHAMTLRKNKTNPSANFPADSNAGNDATENMLAVMTGDNLRLRHGEGGGDVLQLGSQSQTPARLELGDGYFIGPEIQVRPDENYIWIPSAGEFVVPSAFLPPLSASDPESQARWTQSPRGRFGGSMTFDGRVAKLSGGVLLDAAIAQGRQPTELKMRGDELALMLETPVNLHSPATFQTTRLAQISLKQTTDQPVEVYVDRFAADGSRESRHEMLVSELNWIPGVAPERENNTLATYAIGEQRPVDSNLSGQILAPGPGSYRGWFYTVASEPEESKQTDPVEAGNAGTGDQGPMYLQGMIEDNGRSKRTGDAGDSSPYVSGVHLVFQDGMRGDLLGRSLTFQRGVRIGRKIVPDFNTRFDAREMNLLSEDELTLDCDQIRLSIDPSVAAAKSRFSTQTGGSSPPLEVEASGGVVFRSRSDGGLSAATAARCAYSIQKDLVTIEGVPGRAARFQHTSPTGNNFDLAIISMTLRLKPFEILPSKLESSSTNLRPADLRKER